MPARKSGLAHDWKSWPFWLAGSIPAAGVKYCKAISLLCFVD